MAEPVQFNLKPDDLPNAWYNLMPDLARGSCSRFRRCTRGRTSRSARPTSRRCSPRR